MGLFGRHPIGRCTANGGKPGNTPELLATGTADTDALNTQSLALIPPDLANDALSINPEGRYTLIHFFNSFLEDELAAGGDRAASVDQLWAWYRAACMGTNAGDDHSPVEVAPTTSVLPLENMRLNSWVSRVRASALRRLGIGGPLLSNHTFQQGVQAISSTITDTNNARLTYERARDNKSFTDRHGPTVAQLLYNLTGAADDTALPQIHRSLAKATKSQFYAILQAGVESRAHSSDVPLTDGNLPLVTTKLADEVFRCFQPAASGIEFAKGLTPFAIVCQGHAEASAAAKLLKKAEMADRGNSLGLADAEILTTTDVRFPTTPQQAAEKLYGFSVYVDLFHGQGTVIAANVRVAALRMGPALHSVFTNAGTPKTGMELVNRILFEVQQEYFVWCRGVARATAATRPTEPNFSGVINAVTTYRASSLALLPATWYALIEPEPTPARGQTGSGDRDLRSRSGSAPAFNPHADRSLMKRWRDCEHSSISAMMDGKNVTVPKHAGENVCLVWALKGECSENCKRKKQHVRYSANTVKAIGQLLTKCGVPDPSQD